MRMREQPPPLSIADLSPRSAYDHPHRKGRDALPEQDAVPKLVLGDAPPHL